jgi:hypothetical protein
VPKGQTPAIKTTGARFFVNMLSAISNKGRMRFIVTEKNGSIPVFIEFLNRLLFKQKEPVYLIVDGYPVHKSKREKETLYALMHKPAIISAFFRKPSLQYIS